MKTLYNLLAIVAIANLLILGGLIGFLVVSGKLNTESASDIAAILRGEKPGDNATASLVHAQTTSAPSTRPSRMDQNPVDTMEIQLAMLDREKRSVEVDRFSRLKDAEMKLLQDREKLAREQAELKKQVKVERQKIEDEGFNTALAAYSQLSPKKVKEDFMKFDTDIVVRYLTNMSKRTAKKILEEFKTTEEQQKRREIMEKIRTQQNLIKG